MSSRFWATVSVPRFLLACGAAATIALTGCTATPDPPPIPAADPLPPEVHAPDIGEGGLREDSVRLGAETDQYAVWLSRDHADHQCVISLATETRDLSAVCATDAQIAANGLSNSVRVGNSDHDPEKRAVLQVFLLPDARLAAAAAEQISGAERHGELVVRYAPRELERSTTITLRTEGGELQLLVIGTDPLNTSLR